MEESSRKLLRDAVKQRLAASGSGFEAPASLIVPRRCWRSGGGTLEVPLKEEYPTGPLLVCVVSKDLRELNALLAISSMGKALEVAHRDAKRIIIDARHFTVLWRDPAGDDATSTVSLSESSTSVPPPPLQLEPPMPPPDSDVIAAMHSQLLRDAALVLAAARPPFSIQPARLLDELAAAWSNNYAWHACPAAHIEPVTIETLQAEYVLVHLRQLQHARSKRAVVVVDAASPLDALAAHALIPWPAPRGGDSAAPHWIAPMRRVRALAMQYHIGELGEGWHRSSSSSPMDDLMADATPAVGAALNKHMAEAFARHGPAAFADATERTAQLKSASRIRRHLRDCGQTLAAIEPHLPPCMAAALHASRANRHVKCHDRFYSAVYFHTIGQGREENPDTIGEVVRFMTGGGGHDDASYRTTLESLFRKPGKHPWTCSGLRKKRGAPLSLGDGNAIGCPFKNSGECLKSAGLPLPGPNDPPLVFPAHWTRLSMCRAASSLDW